MNPTTTDPSPRTSCDPGLDAEVEALTEMLSACTDDAEAERIRRRLVLACLPVADAVSHRYRGRGVDSEDLEQVARTALVASAARFDPSRGHGFIAFVVPSVVGELKRYFRDHTWTVRPPRRLQELRLETSVAEEELRHRLGREPRVDELAASLRVGSEEVHEVRRSALGYRGVSIDAPVTTEGTLAEHLADPEDQVDRVDTHWTLVDALAGLTERERLLLHLRFVDELTQREVGDVIGVSQMQVSRLLSSILAKLREHVLAQAA